MASAVDLSYYPKIGANKKSLRRKEVENQKVELLFLSQEEMIEAGVLDMHQCVDVIEQAFKLLGQGDYLMGGPSGNHHGVKLWFPKQARGPRMPVEGPDRRFMAVIAYLGGDFHMCGTKWYGSNTENPKKNGLPRSVLMVILNDPETGAPIAIMDGNLISAMRTGAVIGLGARYLANKHAEVAGIIASGVISKTCLMALAVGMPNLKAVKVFDIDRQKAESFSAKMSQELGIDVYAVDSMEAAVRDSDAVSTATSGVKAPFFETEWFKPGAYFGLSSEAKLADDIWLNSRVVADNWQMHLDWREETEKAPADLKKPPLHETLHNLIIAGKKKDEDIVEMGKVVSGATTGRENEEQRVILATGGMGIEDVSWGYTVYKKAQEKGLGQKLKMWDKPHWF
jgi:ornithine cyclodeaminase